MRGGQTMVFFQRRSLGLFRSDYLLDAPPSSATSSSVSPPSACSSPPRTTGGATLRQVELNTIASSFAAISGTISRLHGFVLRELGRSEGELKNLPENNALSGLCLGIIDAWQYFNDPMSVVLFVVEDVSYNICDQRFMEFEVRRLSPATKVMRRSLAQLSHQIELRSDRTLVVDGHTVGVVYYRAGYDPDHYRDDCNWKVRLDIELSSAVKCPSIHYHLAGTKKVQQVLSEPGVVERFLTEPGHVEAVKRMFTNIYPLDFTPEGDRAAEIGLQECEKFVLKPQREGGGNNVYGRQIPSVLKDLGDSRPAWILMERICPPLQPNYILRPGQKGLPPRVDVVSELGVFGVIIGDENEVTTNRTVGHMLRTKTSDADEGGVAAGLGALDSPYLV